ncbi:cupredoxin domain-containing protein [Paenibacillus solisilvae]|uniref:Cupredoxin domain-containing protein n=1 Tax=Paenibacillus solisilvae TaxID=2486751 RepID=A0ABW0VV90_9BACL
MFNKIVRTCLIIIALTSVLAACSGKSSNTESTSTGTNSPQSIKIDMNEFSFSVKQLTVNHGDTVHFILTNSGKFPHDINSEELKMDEDVDPGKTAEFDWTAPQKTGTYKVICDKPGHMDKGMFLSLIVK